MVWENGAFSSSSRDATFSVMFHLSIDLTTYHKLTKIENLAFKLKEPIWAVKWRGSPAIDMYAVAENERAVGWLSGRS